jgi:hypothetical protein
MGRSGSMAKENEWVADRQSARLRTLAPGGTPQRGPGGTVRISCGLTCRSRISWRAFNVIREDGRRIMNNLLPGLLAFAHILFPPTPYATSWPPIALHQNIR